LGSVLGVISPCKRGKERVRRGGKGEGVGAEEIGDEERREGKGERR